VGRESGRRLRLNDNLRRVCNVYSQDLHTVLFWLRVFLNPFKKLLIVFLCIFVFVYVYSCGTKCWAWVKIVEFFIWIIETMYQTTKAPGAGWPVGPGEAVLCVRGPAEDGEPCHGQGLA